MPTSAFEPLDIPAAFWLRDDIDRALGRRDVGGLLRLVRQHTGASQTRLGTAVGLAQGTVSLYMTGHRAATTIDLLERVADGLRMPDSARVRLGLAPHEAYRQDTDQPASLDHQAAHQPNESSPTNPPHHREQWRVQAVEPVPEEVESEMRRRRFMRALAGFVALGSTPPLAALEALRHGLRQAADTRHDRDQWDAIVAEYAHSYYTTTPETLRERLGVDIGILQHLLVEQPDDRDLNRAAANLSMVLAICLTASNEIWLAQRWWGTAHEAVERSGDLGTAVMIRREQAVKGFYDGSSPARVLALSDKALALAGDRVCPGTAGALAARAQALARCGRRDDAAAALRAVNTITERMPDRWLADESMFGWPEHRLRHAESFVYTEIGDVGRATAAHDRALEIYPATQAINRAMVQMHRAACLVGDGHIGTGLRYATESLDALPAEQHSQLLYSVARRAVAKLPPQERHRPEANDLRDRLIALPAR